MKLILPNERSQVDAVSPVVLVTCIDNKDNSNIITLHMYMRLSPDPHLVCINILHQRYSHDLISNSGEFVVNFPSIALEEAMKICGSISGRDVDKFKEAKLTPIPAKRVKPPLIKECYGHLECRVTNKLQINNRTLFVGEVLSTSVDGELLINDNLDLIKAKPILQKNRNYYTISEI
jgi:flavin reductase (DIM6/NTAB) family NADH-FMN oxidoreductase RutF